MKELIVTFEKIGHNGVSIGYFNHKVVFAYGILPNEKAKIRIIKEKHNFIEGELIEILEKSPHRIEPKEDHYLICSPWQTFNYGYQIELKKNLLKEIYNRFFQKEIELNGFFESPEIFGYRTKMEFVFDEDENGLSLAFHKRGDFLRKEKLLQGCILLDKESNQIVLDFVQFLNKEKIEKLKSLIVRKSKNFNDLVFNLLIKKKEYNHSIYSNEKLSGFIVGYSRPQSPASVIDEILITKGKNFLREKILNQEFQYGFNNFFQNNIPLFEKALILMKENVLDFNKIIDLYCGVGVIGISLSDYAKKIVGVDLDQNAIHYAEINAKLNNASHFQALAAKSEKVALQHLENADLLILDPPRAGIHRNVIKAILQCLPKYIFYLACNPLTQARDINYLKEFYKLEKIYGFDFYPNTPHLESLVILKKV
ncbi:MAG: 23S rRNA (uracil(1939)-C(5))-methyltransferase RlmD [Patescibacteria group bacterium]|nr:23S rRNA (uracil(1939)-C(5))-methyltransferase RlmD [Patescibacteria group bacterium]